MQLLWKTRKAAYISHKRERRRKLCMSFKNYSGCINISVNPWKSIIIPPRVWTNEAMLFFGPRPCQEKKKRCAENIWKESTDIIAFPSQEFLNSNQSKQASLWSFSSTFELRCNVSPNLPLCDQRRSWRQAWALNVSQRREKSGEFCIVPRCICRLGPKSQQRRSSSHGRRRGVFVQRQPQTDRR